MYLVNSAFICLFLLINFSLLWNCCRLASRILAIVASFQLFDGLSVICGGILRGCGRQCMGSLWNMICYYAIGLSLAYVFAFKLQMGLLGIWRGVFWRWRLPHLLTFFLCIALIGRQNRSRCGNASNYRKKMRNAIEKLTEIYQKCIYIYIYIYIYYVSGFVKI